MDATLIQPVATPATSAAAKEVIRCKSCRLNQYMTRQGNCRRCHQPLLCPEPIIVANPVVPAPSAGPARPRVDMATAIWMMRSARGLSQRDMARKMGIARTYISKLESNRCMPSAAQISRIAGTLEISEYCLVALATAHNQYAVRD
jgi:DNA-binding XRE family transcriptional regulator